MPTYTVEVISTTRKVYKIEDAKTVDQAKSIAKARYVADAPIGLTEESHTITGVDVVAGQNDNADDNEG